MTWWFAASWEDRPEQLAGPEPAVQQDHRPAGAVRLVVQLRPLTWAYRPRPLVSVVQSVVVMMGSLVDPWFISADKTPRAARIHRPAMSGRHSPLG